MNNEVLWTIDDWDYFRDFSAISNSMLSNARKSLRLFEKLYVTRTIEPEPPTSDMILGSLTHCLILEPNLLPARYIIACCDTRRGKKWEDAKAEADKHRITAVPESWLEQARVMAQAVTDDRDAMSLLKAATMIEQPLRWTDTETGLVRKAKIDIGIFRERERPIVVDLKSTGNPKPSAFEHSALEYGYHCQAVTYSDAAQAFIGESARVLFLCVGKEEPHDVCVNECDDKMLELGRHEVRDAMTQVAVAMRENDFRNNWQRGQVNLLSAPGWALKAGNIN